MSDAPLEYASSHHPDHVHRLQADRQEGLQLRLAGLLFEIPGGKPLGLPVCACILLKAPGRGRKDGARQGRLRRLADAVRPVRAFSPPEQAGSFDLLVKRYDGGAVSTWLHELPVGSMVGFKHIKFNIKAQYPFARRLRITLLCAGTGLTPMFQALHKLMTTPGDDRPVVLLYGNKAPQDILLKEQLDAWAKANPRLKVVHVVGNRPDDPPPPAGRRPTRIRRRPGGSTRRRFPSTATRPPPTRWSSCAGCRRWHAALCGPRTEKELKEGSTLHKLGYTTAMVSKM